MNTRTLHVFTVGRPIGALTRLDVEQDMLLFSYRGAAMAGIENGVCGDDR